MRYAILLALLLCLPVRVEAWQVVGGGPAAVWIETFEAVGYDHVEWSEPKGNPDEDYLTYPIAGLKSLFITTSDSSKITFSSAKNSIDFLVNFKALDNASDTAVLYGLDADDNITTRIRVRTSDVLRVYHGSAYNQTGTILADTDYHIWIDYTPGYGTNGVLNFYFTGYTGSETKPASPSVALTTGTGVADVVTWLFFIEYDLGGGMVVDNITF